MGHSKEGENVIRGLTVAMGGAAILVAGLVGCSSDKKSEYKGASDTPTATAAATASAGSASASAGAGTAKVSIDGQGRDVQGQVVCAAAGGNFNIAIGGLQLESPW